MTTTVEFTCERPGCGEIGTRRTGCYNRAKRKNAPLYHSRACAGLANRAEPVSDDVRRARKRQYDKDRRAALGDRLRAEKRERYAANAKAIYVRQRARMDSDPEYKARLKAVQARCMARPEWKKHKREYDMKRRAVGAYGPFWEAYMCMRQVEDEIKHQQTGDSNVKADSGDAQE